MNPMTPSAVPSATPGAGAPNDVGAPPRHPRLAYLVNHYPKVSHTFIRREILAVEQQGLEVLRLAIRGWDDDAPDPVDQAEKARTHYLLRGGALGLVKATVAQAAPTIDSAGISRAFSARLTTSAVAQMAANPRCSCHPIN